jgi:hypothetical protein
MPSSARPATNTVFSRRDEAERARHERAQRVRRALRVGDHDGELALGARNRLVALLKLPRRHEDARLRAPTELAHVTGHLDGRRREQVLRHVERLGARPDDAVVEARLAVRVEQKRVRVRRVVVRRHEVDVLGKIDRTEHRAARRRRPDALAEADDDDVVQVGGDVDRRNATAVRIGLVDDARQRVHLRRKVRAAVRRAIQRAGIRHDIHEQVVTANPLELADRRIEEALRNR